MDINDWRPCIVTMLDVVGTRNNAETGRASSEMIKLRDFAVGRINNGLPSHAHGYVWNDSVLLLSYETKPEGSRKRVLDELCEFKTALEQNCGVKAYAIAVMGIAFPSDPFAVPVFQGQIAAQPRAVVLKTSSWAMANCFKIEIELKKHRADWYIDSRITTGIGLATPFECATVKLLPKNVPREVHMYKGNFL